MLRTSTLLHNITRACCHVLSWQIITSRFKLLHCFTNQYITYLYRLALPSQLRYVTFWSPCHCFADNHIASEDPGGSMSKVDGLSNISYKPITNTAWVCARLCKLQKKNALDSQPQVIKLTSCFPMVGGSLRVIRLLPPLKTGCYDIAKILLKMALNTKNQSINNSV